MAEKKYVLTWGFKWRGYHRWSLWRVSRERSYLIPGLAVLADWEWELLCGKGWVGFVRGRVSRSTGSES